ncbi:uncharacterized protein LOC126960668 [Macaca thibetana thibetana]|uniref:uncharacterized protein LOC126960668 n=1 Tax=Macaca thibetana thibetana TaxID=257877 RepID=UPI0021BCA309|nr:uncharacterized protein LOC126960668 [Macaca thibetana thibetana]
MLCLSNCKHSPLKTAKERLCVQLAIKIDGGFARDNAPSIALSQHTLPIRGGGGSNRGSSINRGSGGRGGGSCAPRAQPRSAPPLAGALPVLRVRVRVLSLSVRGTCSSGLTAEAALLRAAAAAAAATGAAARRRQAPRRRRRRRRRLASQSWAPWASPLAAWVLPRCLQVSLAPSHVSVPEAETARKKTRFIPSSTAILYFILNLIFITTFYSRSWKVFLEKKKKKKKKCGLVSLSTEDEVNS